MRKVLLFAAVALLAAGNGRRVSAPVTVVLPSRPLGPVRVVPCEGEAYSKGMKCIERPEQYSHALRLIVGQEEFLFTQAEIRAMAEHARKWLDEQEREK